MNPLHLRNTHFCKTLARAAAAAWIATLAWCSPGFAAAAEVSSQGAADPASKAFEQLRLSIQRVTLANGLRIVMNVDRSSPNVAVAVTYAVGSRNEQPGRSGFAHLFEHMMFQGSRNVGKGEHFTLVSERGGSLNGTTSENRTNYYAALPSNELALGLWLEADRMKWLNVTAENFENQRRVVQEEYRLRVANAPYRMGLIRLDELVYEGVFPYSHPTIGSMEDLENAKLSWVQEFHETYYAPNNAVLSIAGDFDPDEAMRLVHEYFADAKPQPALPKFKMPERPEPKAQRRAQVTDQNVRTPGLLMGWPIPETRTSEHYALELAMLILTDGESARLHQKLVRNRGLARSVAGWTNDHPAPDALTLMILLAEKTKLSKVEREVQAAITDLSRRGPTAAELSRAKSRLRSHFIFGLQENLQRAIRLGEFETYYSDARLLTTELDGYLAATRKDIQHAVAKYLTTTRSSIVEVHPASQKQVAP